APDDQQVVLVRPFGHCRVGVVQPVFRARRVGLAGVVPGQEACFADGTVLVVGQVNEHGGKLPPGRAQHPLQTADPVKLVLVGTVAQGLHGTQALVCDVREVFRQIAFLQSPSPYQADAPAPLPPVASILNPSSNPSVHPSSIRPSISATRRSAALSGSDSDASGQNHSTGMVLKASFDDPVTLVYVPDVPVLPDRIRAAQR